MTTTERFAEDIRYVEGEAKETPTNLWKIAKMKINSLTVKKTTPLIQEFLTYTEREGTI